MKNHMKTTVCITRITKSTCNKANTYINKLNERVLTIVI